MRSTIHIISSMICNLIEAAMKFIERKNPWKIHSILGSLKDLRAHHEEKMEYWCD